MITHHKVNDNTPKGKRKHTKQVNDNTPKGKRKHTRI